MQLVTQGFHHVTMVAADARRTLAFYRDVLGLGMVKQTVDYDDPGAYHLYFGDRDGRPGTLLTFFEWPNAPKGRPGIGGVHHTALGVETDEALLKWKRRLTDHGVHTSGPYDRGYFTSLYFRDPDGQIMEIATAGPGYAIDEPADALGRELLLPPERIVRGHRDEAAIAALTWPEPVPEITPDMALHGIHHVSGITDDLVRAGEFYEQALGLRMVKKTTNRDDAKMLHYFWAGYDGQTIAPHSSWTLFGFQPDWNQARGGVGQTHHIAFRAKDDEEQRAWRDHLLSLDVAVSQVMDRTYFRSLYFKAPDGLLVEIATDGPGFWWMRTRRRWAPRCGSPRGWSRAATRSAPPSRRWRRPDDRESALDLPRLREASRGCVGSRSAWALPESVFKNPCARVHLSFRRRRHTALSGSHEILCAD